MFVILASFFKRIVTTVRKWIGKLQRAKRSFQQRLCSIKETEFRFVTFFLSKIIIRNITLSQKRSDRSLSVAASTSLATYAIRSRKDDKYITISRILLLSLGNVRKWPFTFLDSFRWKSRWNFDHDFPECATLAKKRRADFCKIFASYSSLFFFS